MSNLISSVNVLAAEAAVRYVQNATDEAKEAFSRMTPNAKRLTLAYWFETEPPGSDWGINSWLAIQLRLSIKGKIG
jgi:hypothetical protein